MFGIDIQALPRRKAIVSAVLCLLLTLSLASLSPVGAQDTSSATVYAVTADNNLISFSPSSPGNTINSVAITGLGDGESILGIDFRPANGQLYALVSSSRQYVINVTTGAASPVGSAAFSTALNGSSFGFDFNPTVDRIRAVSDARQDLRLHPGTGAVAAVDGTLGYASPDVNSSATPNIVASAYTNSFGTATSTVLYNIDAGLDILVTQNPPNNGTLNTIGALGVDAGSNTSFDIMTDGLGSDAAFAAIGSSFYSINLATGQASLIGSIGGGSVVGISLTGSVATRSGVPACSDFDGSTSPVVGADIPGGTVSSGSVYCRVLVDNQATVNASAASQIGVKAVLDAGVIQAVDIFTQGGNGLATFNNSIKVCLLGSGRFVYLDATQAPRVPQDLVTTSEDGYSCASIPNAGTVVLVKN